MTTQELREALARFPRVPLAEIPTPLHDCPRLAAAAAARLGLKAYLVNQYDRRAEMGIQGNWLLDCLLGAEVRLVTPGVDAGQAKRQLAEELRAAGYHPYVIGERAAI